MKEKIKLVVFQVENQRFAIPLINVLRVVRVVEVSPLAKAPDFILGTINFQGEFMPVVNLRNVFSLPEKEIDLNDQLIITKTAAIKVALLVHSTGEIVEKTEDEILKTNKILLDTKYVKGIFRFEDGMVLLHDLDKLLTPEQVSLLQEAMKKIKIKETISEGGI